MIGWGRPRARGTKAGRPRTANRDRGLRPCAQGSDPPGSRSSGKRARPSPRPSLRPRATTLAARPCATTLAAPPLPRDREPAGQPRSDSPRGRISVRARRTGSAIPSPANRPTIGPDPSAALPPPARDLGAEQALHQARRDRPFRQDHGAGSWGRIMGWAHSVQGSRPRGSSRARASPPAGPCTAGDAAQCALPKAFRRFDLMGIFEVCFQGADLG